MARRGPFCLTVAGRPENLRWKGEEHAGRPFPTYELPGGALGGLDVLVPPAGDREIVDRVIYEELCLGELREASRRAYRRIIGELAAAGAEAVILGCTEIGLLLGPRDADVSLFDTARIHAPTGEIGDSVFPIAVIPHRTEETYSGTRPCRGYR